MSDYIIYDTEEDMQDATDTCYVKYVRDKSAEGYIAGNGTTYADVTGLSDAVVKTLKLYGKNHQGVTVTGPGSAVCYTPFLKAYEQDKWFMPEPPTPYIELLAGYVVKTAQQIVADGYYPPEVA